jgi:hypothetical protein
MLSVALLIEILRDKNGVFFIPLAIESLIALILCIYFASKEQVPYLKRQQQILILSNLITLVFYVSFLALT